MTNSITDAFWLCFVSLLWGATNPLIRKGSKGIEEINRSSRIKQFCAEVIFLASNWKYMVPFLLNQCGSVVFYLTLASADLSIAVPVTNSLTLIITTLVGRILGEGEINTGAFLGMVLIVSGVTICVMGGKS
ncbi:transmembrane protein 234 homolog [Acropora millepora]|uniref:transmembrane protein 234 homolog n=1 Tax=Acropora millepora TaxID=45264 RepID=UPI001CF10377|nr:transmembrane protein 234 homolog [Acropora millepora]